MTNLQNTLQEQMQLVKLYVGAKNKRDAQTTLDNLKVIVGQVKESEDVSENIEQVEKVLAFAQSQISAI